MEPRSPLRFAVGEELLENVEAHFAVIHRVTKVAAFVNPCRGNPADRQIEEALDLRVAFPRARVGKNRDVRLVRQLVFREQGLAVFAAVPDRYEVETHIWVGFYRFEPAAAL